MRWFKQKWVCGSSQWGNAICSWAPLLGESPRVPQHPFHSRWKKNTRLRHDNIPVTPGSPTAQGLVHRELLISWTDGLRLPMMVSQYLAKCLTSISARWWRHSMNGNCWQVTCSCRRIVRVHFFVSGVENSLLNPYYWRRGNLFFPKRKTKFFFSNYKYRV